MKARAHRRFDYQALAEFRYQIRRFMNFSEQAARAAGVEAQQHQALLAIQGLPDAQKATVGVLAERLQIQHHSAVELVDRMELQGLLKRVRSRADRREVLLRVTRHGAELLENLSVPHRTELRSSGRVLLRALETAMRSAGHSTISRRENTRSRRKRRTAKSGIRKK
ncbi:MAG TPA: helix-turn-helix domain-containing protein [Candidatus Acidoferrales bacterium]|nr:helix-turn-helix domain-containing protein [Candidatus Acidoferrales bacterium]